MYPVSPPTWRNKAPGTTKGHKFQQIPMVNLGYFEATRLGISKFSWLSSWCCRYLAVGEPLKGCLVRIYDTPIWTHPKKSWDHHHPNSCRISEPSTDVINTALIRHPEGRLSKSSISGPYIFPGSLPGRLYMLYIDVLTFSRVQMLPTWELTYQINNHFWRSSPKVGYVRFLGGYKKPTKNNDIFGRKYPYKTSPGSPGQVSFNAFERVNLGFWA